MKNTITPSMYINAIMNACMSNITTNLYHSRQEPTRERDCLL